MLEREKRKLEKIAEENGLSKSMITEEVRKTCDKIREQEAKKEDDEKKLSEENIQLRAYRRVRHGIKKVIYRLQKRQKGMIICRFLDTRDFDKNAFKRSMSAKVTNPKEALSEGFVDEEGYPLYPYGTNKGKRIDMTRIKSLGKAIGYIVETNEDGEEVGRLKHILISTEQSEDNIPVTQLGEISLNEGKPKDKDENFPYSNEVPMWYNAGVIDSNQRPPYTKSEIAMVLSQWNAVLGDENTEAIRNSDDLYNFREKYESKQRGDENSYRFCFAPVIVGNINIQKLPNGEINKYKDTTVTLELIEDSDYPDNINLFLPWEHLQGLSIEPGMTGIAVLQAYDYKKGEPDPRWHLGGFLPAQDDIDVSEFFMRQE